MSNVFMYEPFYTFDRFIDQALRSPSGNADTPSQLERRSSMTPRAWRPSMDLHEDTEKNVVTATFELPGVNREDLNVDIHNGLLTIAADTKSSSEHEESGYAVRERKFGRFSRTLKLPGGDIKEKDIKATLVNGILTVTFPKRSPDEERKKITVG